MSRKRKSLIPGFTWYWSWKRALGITAFKAKISRATGIPLTRAARQRKVGAMMGCMLPLLFFPLMGITTLTFLL